jgi:hypothetical protein
MGGGCVVLPFRVTPRWTINFYRYGASEASLCSRRTIRLPRWRFRRGKPVSFVQTLRTPVNSTSPFIIPVKSFRYAIGW